jgi:hypothetical protein
MVAHSRRNQLEAFAIGGDLTGVAVRPGIRKTRSFVDTRHGKIFGKRSRRPRIRKLGLDRVVAVPAGDVYPLTIGGERDAVQTMLPVRLDLTQQRLFVKLASERYAAGLAFSWVDGGRVFRIVRRPFPDGRKSFLRTCRGLVRFTLTLPRPC